MWAEAGAARSMLANTLLEEARTTRWAGATWGREGVGGGTRSPQARVTSAKAVSARRPRSQGSSEGRKELLVTTNSAHILARGGTLQIESSLDIQIGHLAARAHFRNSVY